MTDIRDTIKNRIDSLDTTQREVCEKTKIPYNALNTFLNNHKGLRYTRVQMVLDNLGLSAVGSIPITEHQHISVAVYREIKIRKLSVADIAHDCNVSYTLLCGFINNKNGMKIEKVQGLMSHLGINLQPY